MAPEPGSDELFRKESGMKLKDSFLNWLNDIYIKKQTQTKPVKCLFTQWRMRASEASYETQMFIRNINFPSLLLPWKVKLGKKSALLKEYKGVS